MKLSVCHHNKDVIARGFTFIELLVTVSVLAILVAVAAPSFTQLIRNNQKDSALYSVIGDFQFARSEAVKRSSRVAVCARKSSAEPLCTTTTEIDWANGWLVFTDLGANPGTYEPATETLLRTGNPIPDELNFFSRARVSTSALTEARASFIRFGPRGSSNWRGGGYLLLCDTENLKRTRAIAMNVSLSGDIRRARRDGDDKLVSAFGNYPLCQHK